MEDDVQMYIAIAKESMDSSINHLQGELFKIRTGKASPAILGGILVAYYGSPTPLNQVSNVATSDARTLTIQPWEKSMLAPIEKAIFEANLGLTPQNNGEMIIINIPPLTEERRKQLVKRAKHEGENAKISIRNARRDAISEVKKAVKNDGYPKDAGHKKEEEVDKLSKDFVKKVDALIDQKEKEIMTI